MTNHATLGQPNTQLRKHVTKYHTIYTKNSISAESESTKQNSCCQNIQLEHDKRIFTLCGSLAQIEMGHERGIKCKLYALDQKKEPFLHLRKTFQKRHHHLVKTQFLVLPKK